MSDAEGSPEMVVVEHPPFKKPRPSTLTKAFGTVRRKTSKATTSLSSLFNNSPAQKQAETSSPAPRPESPAPLSLEKPRFDSPSKFSNVTRKLPTWRKSMSFGRNEDIGGSDIPHSSPIRIDVSFPELDALTLDGALSGRPSPDPPKFPLKYERPPPLRVSLDGSPERFAREALFSPMPGTTLPMEMDDSSPDVKTSPQSLVSKTSTPACPSRTYAEHTSASKHDGGLFRRDPPCDMSPTESEQDMIQSMEQERARSRVTAVKYAWLAQIHAQAVLAKLDPETPEGSIVPEHFIIEDRIHTAWAVKRNAAWIVVEKRPRA